jgi:sialidase-1
VICAGSSAYSDLVIQQDNRVGVLFEKDNYTKIMYNSLDLEDIYK